MSKGSKGKKQKKPSGKAASGKLTHGSAAPRRSPMFEGASVAWLFGGCLVFSAIFCLFRGLGVQKSLLGGLVGGVCMTAAVIAADRLYAGLWNRYKL